MILDLTPKNRVNEYPFLCLLRLKKLQLYKNKFASSFCSLRADSPHIEQNVALLTFVMY